VVLAGRALERAGYPVLTTREPGGTPNAEAVRKLLLAGSAQRWSPVAELMLVNAARADHVERELGPALSRGTVVLCDRYVDSTRVYQGLVGGIGLDVIDRLHADIARLPWPDITLLLDLDPSDGMRRRHAEGELTRFEAKGPAFHAAVRTAFLDLARREPGRFQVVDAALPVEAVAAAVEGRLMRALARR
jgi:dTMP kinase